MQHIWVASYPRSGNTFLRTVLNHCFDLKSASVYINDLGGNKKLEESVGHIERDEDGVINFPAGNLPLVKTHELHKAQDSTPAIYVLRDGRAAAISLWKFYGQKSPLSEIIKGNHRFGKWCDHVASWQPETRPNTLFIRYEDLEADLESVLPSISEFLKRDVVKTSLPSRSDISNDDGRWVRKKTNWEDSMSPEDIDLFNQLNQEALEKYGYL